MLQHEKIQDWNDGGIEAVVFTAQGDMRQALNNLQSTFAGTGFISADNVFKVEVARHVDACMPHGTIICNAQILAMHVHTSPARFNLKTYTQTRAHLACRLLTSRTR